jgi:hypothetical protein
LNATKPCSNTQGMCRLGRDVARRMGQDRVADVQQERRRRCGARKWTKWGDNPHRAAGVALATSQALRWILRRNHLVDCLCTGIGNETV